ncbi:hypothetical protein JNUCC83_11495 [Vagococcus sp. JNUCC 83]
MKLYQKYLKTKSYDDDFLRWLLIRNLNLKQQLVIILGLWMAWVYVAPSLKFWVTFFKVFIVIYFITVIINFIIKQLKN